MRKQCRQVRGGGGSGAEAVSFVPRKNFRICFRGYERKALVPLDCCCLRSCMVPRQPSSPNQASGRLFI